MALHVSESDTDCKKNMWAFSTLVLQYISLVEAQKDDKKAPNHKPCQFAVISVVTTVARSVCKSSALTFYIN